MNFFTLTKLGQTLLLVAVLAVGSVSAEEALFYSSSSSGGSDLARLRYEGNVFKQANGNSDYGQPDFYFALKLYTEASRGSYGLRADFVFLRNGRFHGFDVGLGMGGLSAVDPVSMTVDFGLGYTYGQELCFENNLQILYGGSVGLWWGATITQYDYPKLNGGLANSKMDAYYDFFGPSVRIHWHSIEIMYRILFGMTLVAYMDTSDKVMGDQEVGFGARHQLSIGYCFGKNPK